VVLYYKKNADLLYDEKKIETHQDDLSISHFTAAENSEQLRVEYTMIYNMYVRPDAFLFFFSSYNNKSAFFL